MQNLQSSYRIEHCSGCRHKKDVRPISDFLIFGLDFCSLLTLLRASSRPFPPYTMISHLEDGVVDSALIPIVAWAAPAPSVTRRTSSALTR